MVTFLSVQTMSFVLANSASIFTAVVCTIIKVIEQINDYVASIYIRFTD